MSELPKKHFWMVYGIGSREPTYQHPSKSSAIKEAKRLARVSPDTVYVVLESVAAVVKRDVDMVTFNASPCDDDIPF